MRHHAKTVIKITILCTLCIIALSCKERLFNNIFDDPDSIPVSSTIYPINYQNQSFNIEWSKNTDYDFYKYLLYQSTTDNLNNASIIYESESVTDTSYTITEIQNDELRYYWIETLDYWDLKSISPSVRGSSYSKIAYISGDNLLMTMDIDGNNKTVLFTAGYFLKHPMFSPSGKQIVFENLVDNTTTHIGIINSDGTDYREINNVNNNLIYHPQFSPDGQWIYYSSDGIHRIDTNGNNMTIINDNGLFGSFSNHFTPDGNTIVYEGNNESGHLQIYKMGVSGDNLLNLSNNDEYNWGPTASDYKIAFGRSVIDHQEIFIMDINGSNEIQIANTHQNYDAYHPFSPDGQRIAYGTYESGGKLYEYDINSNDKRLITEVDGGIHYPVYYPSGDKIIFQLGNSKIYIVNTDGSGLINLTNNNSWDKHPQIQPQP